MMTLMIFILDPQAKIWVIFGTRCSSKRAQFQPWISTSDNRQLFNNSLRRLKVIDTKYSKQVPHEQTFWDLEIQKLFGPNYFFWSALKVPRHQVAYPADKLDYRISLYSFRGNYCFFNLEIVANLIIFLL